MSQECRRHILGKEVLSDAASMALLIAFGIVVSSPLANQSNISRGGNQPTLELWVFV